MVDKTAHKTSKYFINQIVKKSGKSFTDIWTERQNDAGRKMSKTAKETSK